MIDERRLLERAAQRVEPPSDVMDRLVHRRDRKRRNERIMSAAVALVIAATAVGGFLFAFRTETGSKPVNPPITVQNLADLRVAWTANVSGQPAGLYHGFGVGVDQTFPPTVAGDGVYVATDSGTLYAFPLGCGTGGEECPPSWIADMGSPAPYPPVVSDGVVYVSSREGTLFVFSTTCGTDGATCKPIWIGDTGRSGFGFSPVVADGLVLGIDAFDGLLYAFDDVCERHGAICEQRWTARIHQGPNPMNWSFGAALGGPDGQAFGPTVADGVVYAPSFGTDQPDRLYAIDESTGRRLRVGRAAELGTSPFWNLPAVADGYVLETFQTSLYAWPTSCKSNRRICPPAWSVGVEDLDFDTVMGRPAVADGIAYVKAWSSEYSGHTYAFPLDCGKAGATCEPLWRAADDGFGDLAVADGVVYSTAVHNGAVDAIPASCKALCRDVSRLPAPEGPLPPVVANGVVYWGTERGAVHGVPTSCGGRTCSGTWTWRGPASATSSPAVGDGLLVVASADGTIRAFAPAPGSRGLSASSRRGATIFSLGVGLLLVVLLVFWIRRRRSSRRSFGPVR